MDLEVIGEVKNGLNVKGKQGASKVEHKACHSGVDRNEDDGLIYSCLFKALTKHL